MINVIVSPGYYWFTWVFFGWGIAVACHGISVYYEIYLSNEDEKVRAIRKLRE